jgi:hypothetical protein
MRYAGYAAHMEHHKDIQNQRGENWGDPDAFPHFFNLKLSSASRSSGGFLYVCAANSSPPRAQSQWHAPRHYSVLYGGLAT